MLAVSASLDINTSKLGVFVDSSDAASTAYVRLKGNSIEVSSDAAFTAPLVGSYAATNVATIVVTGATGGDEGLQVAEGFLKVVELRASDVEKITFTPTSGITGSMTATTDGGLLIDGLNASSATLSSAFGGVAFAGVVAVNDFLNVQALDDIVQLQAAEINAPKLVATIGSSGDGDVLLANAQNTIGAIEATNTRGGGLISISSDSSVVIGISPGHGLSTTADGAIAISAGGDVTQSADSAVSTANLSVSTSGGDIRLTAAGNNVRAFSAKNAAAGGGISFSTIGNLELGIGQSGVVANGGVVDVAASGEVSQLIGTGVTADILRVVGNGAAIDLTSSLNTVDVFEGSNTYAGGSISFSNGTALQIGSAGVLANGGEVIVLADGPILVLGPLHYNSLTVSDQSTADQTVRFVVTTDSDALAGVDGSLRDRLRNVQDNLAVGQSQSIEFATNVVSIALNASLDKIERPVAIDGGATRITIDGSLISDVSSNGFWFGSGSEGSALAGLSIGGFNNAGVLVETAAINVADCFIGVTVDDAGGFQPLANSVGVLVRGIAASDVSIGLADYGNVIASNRSDGVRFTDGASGEVVASVIGLEALGLGNGGSGISLDGAANVFVGGPGVDLGNDIRGNAGAGVEILHAVSGASLEGNVIIGNGGAGVRISQSVGVVIGGQDEGAANTISGNTGHGVEVAEQSSGTVILANIIGLDSIGQTLLGNKGSGVLVHGGSSDTAIGKVGFANVISGNASHGIWVVEETEGTSIVANTIGLDSEGSQGIGNEGHGIFVDGASGTFLDANTVSGNVLNGIVVSGASASTTTVMRNVVGLTRPMDSAVPVSAAPNGGVGILVENVPGLVIGGSVADRNVVAGNISHGILVVSSASLSAQGTRVLSNYVGISTGLDVFPNGGDGVRVEGSGAVGVELGNNVVSGNTGVGIRVTDGAAGSRITGNVVGLTPDLAVAVGNQDDGIRIEGGDSHFIGGDEADTNIVGGNKGHGIAVFATSGTLIERNVSGTNQIGSLGLGNARDGIAIIDAANTTITINVSSGNEGSGISVSGASARETKITGNHLGTEVTGIKAVPNQQHGIKILGGTETTFGGELSSERNVASGNVGNGVYVAGASSTGILGNYVGVTSNGYSALGNKAGGVLVLEATDTSISGGNVIAFNGSDASGHGVAIAGGSDTTVGDRDAGLPGGNAIFRNRGDGIRIEAGAVGTVVVGNSIGSTAVGTVGLGNDGAGVAVVGVNGTVIGGLRSAAGGKSLGNLIVGNGESGVSIRDALPDTAAGEEGNLVQGNVIRRNAAAGVSLEASASQVVGGTAATLGNEIGENLGPGVLIDNTAGGLGGHVVAGNAIGTDASGSQRLGNLGDGVSIVASVGNTIGGVVGAGNVISFNRAGVVVTGALPGSADEGNLVAGNTIAANVGDGVRLEASSLTTVGSNADLPANLVVLNGGVGVAVNGGSGNLVIGNLIGTDSIGGVKSNGRQGVLISASSENAVQGNTISWNRLGGVRVAAGGDNVIGGAGLESNAIRANGGPGVALAAGTSGNTVSGNLVRGNAAGGISLASAVGTVVDSGNVVARNQKFGIAVTGGADNVIDGNFVGTNATETAQLGNLGPGIVVTGGVGTEVGRASGNVVRFNGSDGIQLVNTVAATTDQATSVVGNTSSSNAGNGLSILGGSLVSVTGNTLGGLVSGAGNGRSGISIAGGASGTVLTGNRVDGNAATGAELIGAVNTVIGSDVADDDNTFTGNRSDGVRLSGGAIGTVIGSNVVSGNGGDGIEINGSVRNAVSGTTISGNVGSGVAVVSAKPASPADGNEIVDATISANAVGISVLGSAGTRVTGGTVSDSRGAGVLVASKSSQTTILGTSIMGSRGAGVEINASRSTAVVGASISAGAAAGILLSQASGASAADANVVTGNDVFANAASGISLIASSFNTIGGIGGADSNAVHGNRGHGVALRQGSNSNILLGNFIGLDADQVADGNALDGVRITGGFGNVIGEGNLISENVGTGVSVLDSFAPTAATGNRIEAAVIQANGGAGIALNGGAHVVGGTLGNTIEGNGGDGVAVTTGSGVSKIAGPTIAGNTIGGNGGNGVSLTGVAGAVVSANAIGDHAGAGIALIGGMGNRVVSNVVGGASEANVTGIALSAGTSQNVVIGNEVSGNEGDGISIAGARSTDNLVGVRSVGLGEAGVANRVFANLGAGIRVAQGVRNQVAGNSIFGNVGGGIVLQDGGNSAQPAPTLSSAKRVIVAGRSQVQVSGEVRGAARQKVVIEFFRNNAADGNPAARTGYQTRTTIGRVTVVLDAAGKGTFTTTLAADVPVGDLLTAVATTASGVVGNASQQSAVAVPV